MVYRLAPPLFGLLLILHLSAGGKAQAQERLRKITVQPDHVTIGLLYGGCDVHVEAGIPVDYDVVIRVSGAGEPQEFKKKGKKFGLIWMSEGEIRYEDVPSLYIIRSSRRLSQIASPETLDQLNIGYDALYAKEAEGSGPRDRALFGDLVKLKERDGLFSMKEGSIQLRPRDKGQQEVSTDFLLPAKTPLGEYRLDVFGFSEGKGVLLVTDKLKIERSAIVSFIISMATGHGLFHGCLAVGIAIIAGLLTGFAFGLGRRGVH